MDHILHQSRYVAFQYNTEHIMVFMRVFYSTYGIILKKVLLLFFKYKSILSEVYYTLWVPQVCIFLPQNAMTLLQKANKETLDLQAIMFH